ncbi:hypothetical protein ABZZ17_28095 [Streptomyces sp. NPDC006512]|uniref:hypothetical protein n=1 Tax=Streptomyces sp. NPDC006512 TaxID=3154307 RepID=UPI0033BB197D
MTGTTTRDRPDTPMPPPPDGDVPARRSAGDRLLGAALIALSLVPALACFFLAAEMLPSDVSRYEAYAATGPCPGEDCLRTVSFTVESVVSKDSGKSTVYDVIVHGTPFGRGLVPFGGGGPLVKQLRPGDRVTGTVWRGDVMALSRDGIRESSADEPRDEAQMTAGVATFAGLLAALGLVLGTVRLAGGDRHGHLGWRPFVKPMLIGTGITCGGVAFLALALGVPWWVVPAVVVPFVGYAARQLHRYRRAAVR